MSDEARPRTAPERLRVLAKWLDVVHPEADEEVQNDLRADAKTFEEMQETLQRFAVEMGTLISERNEADAEVERLTKLLTCECGCTSWECDRCAERREMVDDELLTIPRFLRKGDD